MQNNSDTKEKQLYWLLFLRTHFESLKEIANMGDFRFHKYCIFIIKVLKNHAF